MGSTPARGPVDYFSPDDWNIYCSICGTKLKFSQAVQNWQGQYRHARCNEPRHPQDFVQALTSQEMAIPVPQNMGEIDIPICTLDGISAIPDLAEPDCAIPDRTGSDIPVTPLPPLPPLPDLFWTADSGIVTADSGIYTADG